MPLQILSLKLDGITAGDYLTRCRDPEPSALDFALRSVAVDADPLGDTGQRLPRSVGVKEELRTAI